VLVEEKTEIIPGVVSVRSVKGHTDGSLLINIRSGNRELIYLGDIFIHPLHISHPEWAPIFDHHPHVAEKMRNLLIDAYTNNPNVTLVTSHFPFPSTGKIVKSPTMQRPEWIFANAAE